ncbi:MAG TPA: DUF58 domain-containing protein [Vicinamibacterales bacterium]|nr:DUF58 domain-containing protein [Vicinamibacterales bacterium]
MAQATTAPGTDAPLVNLSEIAEIELFILRRMKEYTLGDHASMFKGAGFNFVGVRDWQPGDRVSSIDWAQSSLNNFSPLVTRDFEQDSNATIVAVADASMSTRCGVNGVPIAAAIARSVAAVGLSAVFFQDQFGLITFDDQFRQMAAARPRIGKPHVIYCVNLYQEFRTADVAGGGAGQDVTSSIEGHLRKTSMVPVISDFLLPDVERVIKELSHVSGMHDVFLIMADVRYAYQLPRAAAGWIETFDIETGATCVVSRREFARMGARIEEWQAHVASLARDNDLDIVRVGLDRWEMETTLIEFARERKLRKFQ